MSMIEIAGEDTPLLPEGIYDARFLGWGLSGFMGNGKLSLSLEVLHKGEWIHLESYFNVEVTREENGQQRFKVRARAKYFRMMRRLFLTIENDGGNFLSPDLLENKRLTVSVRTVTTDYRREPLDQRDWYSKVDEIRNVQEAA